jgi:outer membrane protein assembly factor BamB
MGRRRALAALAGVATGGVAVAAWELSRPGQAAGPAGTLSVRPRQRPGTKVWSFTANGPVRSVAVSGGTVFAGTATSKVYALDASTGQPVWQRSTPRQFNDKMAAAGQAVYVADATDSGAYALDAVTGRQLWSIPTTGAPLGLSVAGGVVYLGVPAKSTTTGGVSALSADQGGLLWSAEFGPVSDVTAGFTVAGGTVYAASTNGELFAYEAASGIKRWRIAGKNIAFGTPPAVASGVVYVSGTASSGTKATALYAVRAATGRQLWQQPTGVSQYPANLAVAGGAIYAAFTRSIEQDGPGDLTALHAATGQPRWKVSVASGAYPAPVPAAGVVYGGSNDGVLTARQAGTGRRLWAFTAAGGIGTAVQLAGGTLYFGAGNRVYAVAAQ